MHKPLQVGIIGASAKGGWARESHVPAVQQLAGLELGAVAVRKQDEADAAAKAFGARRGYTDPRALFDDPEIDIVTVAVKVPDHHDLVLGALRAGKHVCNEILNDTHTVPDFEHAVCLTRLIEGLLASSADGRQREASDWPCLRNAGS